MDKDCAHNRRELPGRWAIIECQAGSCAVSRQEGSLNGLSSRVLPRHTRFGPVFVLGCASGTRVHRIPQPPPARRVRPKKGLERSSEVMSRYASSASVSRNSGGFRLAAMSSW